MGLSGNARPAQIQAGMDAGMDSFVTKPYRYALQQSHMVYILTLCYCFLSRSVLDLLSKLVGEEEASFPNVESTERQPTETPAQTLRETASP